jgi:hypothetical protein
MKTITLTTIVTAIAASCLSAHATSAYCFDPDTRSYTAVEKIGDVPGARFVRAGYNGGYFVVQPGSKAITVLGLQRAPIADSDNVSRNGVGQDAIAFHFGADDRLEGFPMYISQLSPDSSYVARLSRLAPGHSTLKEVAAMFDGDTLHLERRGGCTVAFLAVPVYDPNASGS